jgi:hypothetical protein
MSQERDSRTGQTFDEWHVCGWDMTIAGCEGMVEVLDVNSQLVCRAKDKDTAHKIVAAWNAVRGGR